MRIIDDLKSRRDGREFDATSDAIDEGKPLGFF